MNLVSPRLAVSPELVPDRRVAGPVSVTVVEADRWQALLNDPDVTAGAGFLGGACFGPDAPRLAAALRARGFACAAVDAQPLPDHPAAGFAELWRIRANDAEDGAVAGVRNGVHFRAAGDFLFACVSFDEASIAPQTAYGRAAPSALQAASHTAYQRLFELADELGRPCPLRFWNYVPRINDIDGGLERYRYFNLGRHDAFIAARRPPDQAPPAACALGTPGGDLVILMLAGRRGAGAIENPRQVSAYRYPTAYGPVQPTFSRAGLYRHDVDGTAAAELLLISGTASIVGHETLHIGDVSAQTVETVRNLEVLIEQANGLRGIAAVGGEAPTAIPLRLQDLALKAYVRNPEDAETIAATIYATIGEPTSVHLVKADICRADLLVEIEACASVSTAIAGAGSADAASTKAPVVPASH